MGELDLNPGVDDGAEPIDVSIERTLVHPKYNALDNTDDIAILKLKDVISFTSKSLVILYVSANISSRLVYGDLKFRLCTTQARCRVPDDDWPKR